MEVILLEKIRNLGNTGEIVNVKDGYGRNFLLKTGKALRADKKNIEFVKRKKDEINKKNIEQKKYANKIFEKIKGKNLTFKKETKENGDLFASIKPKEISKYFIENLRETIHPSQMDLKKEINKIFEKIRGKNLTFKKETKENGDLFASIKPKEISKYFIENLRETIHPSQMDLKKEINKIGKFSLSVNLHPEVVAQLHVLVEKKEAK